MTQAAVVAALYLAAAFICVLLSGYSTFRGFEDMLKGGAVFAAVAIGIGLMVCNIAILRLVQNPRSTFVAFLAPLAGLLFFAAFSSVSNFTYFYSLVMEQRVAENRLAEAAVAFDRNIRTAENQLASRSNYTQTRQEALRLSRLLRDQVTSITEPGFGRKALEHLNDIYGVVPMTQMRPPAVGSPEARNLEWLDRFEIDLNRELDQMGAEDAVALAAAQVTEIGRTVREDVAEVQNNTEATPTEIVAAVQQMGQASAEVENKMVQAAQRVGRPTDATLEPIRYEDIALHNINNVFVSVQRNDSPGLAFLAAALAIFIDFIPLLIGLVIRALGLEAPRPRRSNGQGVRPTVLDGER